MKKVILFKDGDSGEMIGSDGRTEKFRLSNVSAPEAQEPGHNIATTRSKKMVGTSEVVDVKVVGRDTFGRELIEVFKNGRNVNNILEMKNRLFTVEPKKEATKKDNKKTRRTRRKTKKN